MSDKSKNPRVTTLGSFMMDLVAYTPSDQRVVKRFAARVFQSHLAARDLIKQLLLAVLVHRAQCSAILVPMVLVMIS
jgi:hypothetical protein